MSESGMRLGVLAAPNSWYVKDLVRAAGESKSPVDLVCLPFTQLTAQLNPRPTIASAGCDDLSSLNAVLVRSMPPGSLEQIVFRMNALHRLQAADTHVVNSPRCLEIAIDKYLALAQLEAAGLEIPPTRTSQTWRQAMDDFQQLGSDVVVKPIFGSEGRGIVRVSDESMAWRLFRSLEQLGHVIYQQTFVAHHGCDLRVFVLGDRMCGVRRSHASDWRTNVARGALCEPLHIDDRLADMARRAVQAVGAQMAGVDFLPAQDGKLYVLEVNAVPGWRALARTLDRDIAADVLEYLRALVG